MHVSLDIHSRDEFINFARMLGEKLKASPREKPWIILLGADEGSGKELIALAIDQAFHPEHYPDGITQNLSADKMLDPKTFQTAFKSAVIFHNFRRQLENIKEYFDEALVEFETSNPSAKVLVASNIERTFTGNFNYAAKGLDSDRLDMNIHVHKLPGDFSRRLAITIDDQDIFNALFAGNASTLAADASKFDKKLV